MKPESEAQHKSSRSFSDHSSENLSSYVPLPETTDWIPEFSDSSGANTPSTCNGSYADLTSLKGMNSLTSVNNRSSVLSGTKKTPPDNTELRAQTSSCSSHSASVGAQILYLIPSTVDAFASKLESLADSLLQEIFDHVESLPGRVDEVVSQVNTFVEDTSHELDLNLNSLVAKVDLVVSNITI